jgi:hypothetical protein
VPPGAEHRVAQRLAGCAVRVDGHDQAGCQPVRPTPAPVDGQCAHGLAQRFALIGDQPRGDLSDPPSRRIAREERLGSGVGLRLSGGDLELIAAAQLVLAPVVRAPRGLPAGVQALGDHALKLVGGHDGQHVVQRRVGRLGDLPAAAAGGKQLAEQRLALVER